MCIPLLQEANRICADPGTTAEECARAHLRYARCEIARAGRASDTRADDRMMALIAMLEEAEEALFGKLKIPPRPCGRASIEARAKIFADKAKAMTFSRKIAEAFDEAHIELDKGQSYACLVCVVDKPRLVSEAMALDPLAVNDKQGAAFNYVMEPAVMKSVMKHLDGERIDY